MIVEGQISKTQSAKLRNQKRAVVYGLQWVLLGIRKYGTREMGNKSFKEVGLEVHDDAIICDPKTVLLKYKQNEYLTGEISHKMVTYASQFMALADKFIALGSLPDAKLWENIDLVKELYEYTDQDDLEREKRALTQQRCVILVTPTLTDKQALLKRNEEKRKKNEEEKQKKREQVQLDMARGQIALEERRKKELADLKAAIERCQAELQEKDRQIDLMKRENGAIREGSPRKKGQKRKNAPSTSSSASNGGQEGFSDGMLRTLTTTFENKVVESLGRDRGEGKRAVKPKLRSL